MIQGVFRAQAEDAFTPATALTRVNKVMARRTIASRYATGFYGVLSPDGRFVSSNAGHNPPIIVRRDGTVLRLEKGGTPLGLFAGMRYQEEETTLAPGDTLLLFSDGLSEAENAELLEFGDERLIECLSSERHREAADLLEYVLASARDFAGGHPQNDDVTALIVRCRET
jgi:sigma-B regulation protein RsbU (phosphoserine phosphatase)